MSRKPQTTFFLLAIGLLGGWILLRYGLPILLPFGLGLALAIAAEPSVRVLAQKLHLPRPVAAGIGVTAVFALALALAIILIAFLVREAGQLSRIMPELTSAAQQGLDSLQSWLLTLSAKAPDALRPVLENTVISLFSGSGATMERFTDRLLSVAAGLFSRIAASALTVATAVLSAYMISARLPQLRQAAATQLPPEWRGRYLPALRELKGGLFGWLTAQLKLSGITLVQLLAGFWLLRIPHAAIWAVGVALVDAFPVLGTGTILIPWSIICLLQGQTARGAGLLGLYAVVWLVRSVLEPRLLGKELGLDPLVTLLAMYTGYKLLGILGMILSPLLAVAAVRLVKVTEK